MLAYIIDEERISLYLTEQVLRLEGSTTHIRKFGTAGQALAFLLPRLATELPDLIFLDLNRPVLDGWDFLQALEPYAPLVRGRCRIYLLTSSLAPAHTARAKDYALVSGIIHKPIDEEEIRAIQARGSGPDAERAGAWG